MKKKYTLLLLPVLLLSGCTATHNAFTFSDTVYFHNDAHKMISLSNRDKNTILDLIESLTFISATDETDFFRSDYHYSINFLLTDHNEERLSYSVDLNAGLLLRANPAISSTFSDEFGRFSADQIQTFKDIFGVVRENESEGIKLARKEVIYDYGFHIQDKLTALLGDSLFFFDYNDYDITHFFAGDLFEIYYKGEMFIQETYPSTVVTDNLTIVDVLRLPSRIMEGTLLGVPGSSLYNFVGANYANHVYPEYVVNSDFTYEPVSNFHDEKVYASFCRDDLSEKPTIKALFSFNPLSVWPPVLE